MKEDISKRNIRCYLILDYIHYLEILYGIFIRKFSVQSDSQANGRLISQYTTGKTFAYNNFIESSQCPISFQERKTLAHKKIRGYVLTFHQIGMLILLMIEQRHFYFIRIRRCHQTIYPCYLLTLKKAYIFPINQIGIRLPLCYQSDSFFTTRQLFQITYHTHKIPNQSKESNTYRQAYHRNKAMCTILE